MRVTSSMMMHNMVYWTAKQQEKLNDASNVVASGKQINKPSDDPTAVRQIQQDKTTISSYEQYEYNLELAQTWISVSDTTLTSIYSLLESVEGTVSSSIESGSDEADSVATFVDDIGNQVLSMANSRYGTSYMYSGNCSDTKPFANEVTVSTAGTTTTATAVVFDLAAAATAVTVAITDSAGNVVRTLTATTGTTGTNTITWDGLDDDGNALSDGDYTFTVSATNANGSAVASYPSYRGDEGGKKFVGGEDPSIVLNNNGGEIFSPALKALSQISITLRDSSGTEISNTALSTMLEDALSQIENQEIVLANTGTLVTNATDRLDKLTTYIEGRISDIETGSVEEASAKLTAQETAYEVTITAEGSILKMAKLSDYL